MSTHGVVSRCSSGSGLAGGVEPERARIAELLGCYARSPFWSDVDKGEVIAKSIAYLSAVGGHGVECDGYARMVEQVFAGSAVRRVVESEAACGLAAGGDGQASERPDGRPTEDVSCGGGRGSSAVGVDVGAACCGSVERAGSGANAAGIPDQRVVECGDAVKTELANIDDGAEARALVKREKRRRARERRRQRAKTPAWRVTAAPIGESVAVEKRKSGFFSDCDEATQVELRETRAKLLIAQNKRALVEEQRKLKDLQSPMRIMEEAMRMVNFAEKCAKAANDNKVAGWAATVSESYAESVARSAGSSVPSLDSVTSWTKLRKKRDSMDVAVTPLTDFELLVLQEEVMTAKALEEARKKALRPLVLADFSRKNVPSSFSAHKLTRLRCLASGRPELLAEDY